MKKGFLLIAAAFVMLSSSSCYKSYTCVCKDTFGEESEHLVNGASKREARYNCDQLGIKGNCTLLIDEEIPEL